MLRTIMAVVSLLAVTQVHAEEDRKSRFGIGVAKVQIELDDLGLKGDDTGWEVFTGYEFNRYVAIEAGYINAGEAEDSAFGLDFTAESTAFHASVLISAPMGSAFSIYGRAGLLHWEAEQSASDGFITVSEEIDGDDPFYGVGAAISGPIAMVRLEYRIAELEDSDLTAIGLSAAWRF
jgi:OmpA-OmpF porin, OOP family